jgi:3-oxoacyl-[acyl-carrier protein] reductase
MITNIAIVNKKRRSTMQQFEDKTVLITGGSSGMGKAIAEAFIQRSANVVLVGRTEKTLRETARSLGTRASWYQVDVSDGDTIRAVVNDILTHHKHIDILINAAGFTGTTATTTPFAEAEQTWDAILDANLKGSFLVSMAVAPKLSRPGGRIINISSIAAFTGGSSAGAIAYASAKAGVLGLTYALARELSPQGITVNAIAPGFVPETRFFGGTVSEERIRTIVDQTPMGRVGRTGDIAAAALYLASPEASFVTGEVLNINGGWLFGR